MTKLMLSLRCIYGLTVQLKVDMINAWSLLYDEMNDQEWVAANGGYEYTPPVSADGYSISISDATAQDYEDFWSSMKEDRIDFTPEESISLNLDMTNNNGFWKYNEDVILKELREYLSGTYRSHYTSQESKTQTLDLIEGIGDAEAFCRSNAIKYLSRFGKKNGKSKFDILKAIHYCVLLYHFSGVLDQPKGNYETF